MDVVDVFDLGWIGDDLLVGQIWSNKQAKLVKTKLVKTVDSSSLLVLNCG